MLTEEHGLGRSADSGQGTWNRGVSKEEVSLHWDLVPGISVSVIDGPRVSLDPVIELCPPACLKHIKVEIEWAGTEPACAVLGCAPGALPGTPGAQWPADEEIRTRTESNYKAKPYRNIASACANHFWAGSPGPNLHTPGNRHVDLYR